MDIPSLIDDLVDDLSEATIVALADAVFLLERSSIERSALCFQESEAILARLRAHGFEIVKRPASAPS